MPHQEPAPAMPAAVTVAGSLPAVVAGAGTLSTPADAESVVASSAQPPCASQASVGVDAVHVRLECSAEQAAIICRALDFYDRVAGLGQFGELAYQWAQRNGAKADREQLEAPLRELHVLVMPDGIGGNLGASYGIHSPEVPDEHRASFDLKQVIRHALWQSRPESTRARYTVDAYPARRTSEHHDLARCEAIDLPPREPVRADDTQDRLGVAIDYVPEVNSRRPWRVVFVQGATTIEAYEHTLLFAQHALTRCLEKVAAADAKRGEGAL